MEDFIAPDNVATFDSIFYTAPTNSAYLASDGYSNCGPLSYSLLTSDGQPFEEDWITVNLNESSQADSQKFYLSLEQEPSYTKVTLLPLIIEIKLEQHPEST